MTISKFWKFKGHQKTEIKLKDVKIGDVIQKEKEKYKFIVTEKPFITRNINGKQMYGVKGWTHYKGYRKEHLNNRKFFPTKNQDVLNNIAELHKVTEVIKETANKLIKLKKNQYSGNIHWSFTSGPISSYVHLHVSHGKSLTLLYNGPISNIIEKIKNKKFRLELAQCCIFKK